jgi:UDP-GlcNAc:undecaprenyl-phosphate GlcNAc-1-phosphate transferase
VLTFSAAIDQTLAYGAQRAAIAGVVACLLTWLLVPIVSATAVQYGVVDRPGARRVHNTVTPRLGGVAVMIAVLVTATASYAGDFASLQRMAPHLTLGCLLLAVGAADDIAGLRPSVKLTGTIVAALVGAAAGLRIDGIAWPWGGTTMTGALAVPLSVFWIVAVCHAVNLVDGLDGLAGTIAVVAAIASAITRLGAGMVPTAVLSMVLAGAIIGFLIWNWTPASIFLGDAGSLGIGGLLAVLALVPGETGGRTVRTIDVTSLLLLAYPILDTTLAVLRRWLRSVPISVADRGHIHHRLLNAGLRQPMPTICLGLWSAAAASLGLALRHTDNSWLFGKVLVGGGVLLVGLFALRRLGIREIDAIACAVMSLRRTWRRVIRDHILTSDAAEQLRAADTLDEVEAALTDCSRRVGLLGAELTRSSARRRITESLAPSGAVAVWSLDWPLTALPGPTDDPIVLRLYGGADGVMRPHTAARAAEALLPAISSWLTLPRQCELVERRPAARRGRRVERESSSSLTSA